jgi:pyrrolidone-carboxylate peptidase
MSSRCSHDIQALLSNLAVWFADKLQALGHDVQISHSAGRYLCNYIYFRSLQHCTNVPNWHALFVHVPPLKFAGQEAELAFSLDLFDQLAHQVKASVPLNQIAS